MSRILYKDTDGTKGSLPEATLGYDAYTAGGDEGRVAVGTAGGVDIPLAKKSEVDEVEALKADKATTYTKTESDTLKSISTVASSVLTNMSSVAINDFLETKNFASVTYTGNGTSQSIVTGISSVDFTVSGNGSGFWLDRTVNQVKTDAGAVVASGDCVVNTSKVHIKQRSGTSPNIVTDSIIGVSTQISTNATTEESVLTSAISLSPTGVSFSFGAGYVNGDTETYIVYQTLYTHIKWGVTSQGKFQIEAYNPVTREGMIYYLGSGIVGHEISHSQGVEIDVIRTKSLTTGNNWIEQSRMGMDAPSGDYLNTNTTVAISNAGASTIGTTFTVNNISIGNTSAYNGTDQEHIMYYKCKSETFAIGTYMGTEASGNFIETRDVYGVARKPRRVIIKRIDNVGYWGVYDTERLVDSEWLELNTSNEELTNSGYNISVNENGFTVGGTTGAINAENAKYLYLVEFDTKAGITPDDSYFNLPTDGSNLTVTNGYFNFTDGVGAKGYNLTTKDYTGTIDLAGVSDGIKFIGLKEDNSVVAYDKISQGSYVKESADDNRLVIDSETGKQYVDIGGELVVNGTFDTDISGWNGSASLSHTSASLQATISARYQSFYQDGLNLISGQEYNVSFEIISSNVRLYVGFGDGAGLPRVLNPTVLSAGVYTYTFTANSARLIFISDSSSGKITIDNISVFKVEPTLQELAEPVSMIKKPIMVQSETPMAILDRPRP